MRDAFGGTFVIKLILIFIVIYISFMAIAMQYAKTFRVKNLIINKLEQSQYDGSLEDEDVLIEISDTLGQIPYNINDIGTNTCNGEKQRFITSETGTSSSAGGGFCLEQKGTPNKPYYKVTTYIVASLPLFGINITIPISGETKIIYQ